jgi:hypothetical protein
VAANRDPTQIADANSLDLGRPESAVEGRKLFEPPPPIPSGALPDLPAEEINYTGAYIVDWLGPPPADRRKRRPLGRARDRPEQNRRLGEILSIIAAARGRGTKLRRSR